MLIKINDKFSKNVLKVFCSFNDYEMFFYNLVTENFILSLAGDKSLSCLVAGFQWASGV